MSDVRIEPWVDDDLDVLQRANSPAMTAYLGGSEAEEKVLERHRRYLKLHPPAGQMYHVLALPEEAKAGSVGFWEREWQGQQVYEVGWGTLPEFQGRGIAVAATIALLDAIRDVGNHRYVLAYPRSDHPASNAVAEKAGFTLVGQSDYEYPPGNPIHCNDWRFDVRA